MEPDSLTLTLTREQAQAITLGLAEYVYLMEEGNIRELLDEIGWKPEVSPMSALDAVALKERIGKMAGLPG
jgi:hypothetical protein